MPIDPLLADFLIVLGAAIAVIVIFRPLRLPPTLGFMLTGMLIGPSGLGAVAGVHQVEALADLGVTLLLFVIGLEFSIGRLREYRRAFFAGGALQVLLTAGAGAAIALTVLSPARAVILGGMIALSSTAMVFRLLAERREGSSPAGRIMSGVLLFQDFAMVPMIAVVPALAGQGVSLGALPSLLLGLVAAVGAFIAARYLMPRAIALVVHSRVREMLVIGAVFVCLGSAAATSALGLSAALGAFLAGILISESEYSHQVIAEILPFRDLFNSLFFVSIGMLLDLRFLVGHLPLVAATSVMAVMLKGAISVLVVRMLGYPIRVAVIVGLGLAQIGEFSFVIGRLSNELGLLEGPHYQAFLATAIVTLGATPFLMRLAPEAGVRIARLLPRRWSGPQQEADTTKTALSGHVLIIGYGLNGRNVARVLKAVGIPYIALDLDASVIARARRDGEENLVYGDATRAETLQHGGVERAAVVVFAIADPDSDRRGVRMVRALAPNATIIVRTRLASQVPELQRLGADDVIPEEFETSIAIFARVLRRLQVPANVIRSQELLLRSESYGFLREDTPPATALERASELLAAGTTSSFLVTAGSYADGKTISQTALHSKTRTMIIAVVRDAKPTVSPGADFLMRHGDVLVLVGDHAALEAAFLELGE